MKFDEKTGHFIKTSPAWPCQCGGTYTLGYEPGSTHAVLTHTLPRCERFIKVNSTDDAVQFSKENREAIGHYGDN